MILIPKPDRNIVVKSPCSEPWAGMTPVNEGSFCHACKKTVTDFTSFSNEDFIRYFQQHQNPGCGKFRKEQMSIPIRDVRQTSLPIPGLARFAATLLLGALALPSKANAQTMSSPTEQSAIPSTPEVASLPVVESKARGKILDDKGEGIPGAFVMIKGMSVGTVTDIDGNFELDTKGRQTLTFKAMGMQAAEMVFDGIEPIIIRLQPADDTELSEAIDHRYFLSLRPGCGKLLKDQFPLTIPQSQTETSSNQRSADPKGSGIKVRGKILDDKGEGIPGAVMLIKDTPFGTVTDIDGNFELEIEHYEKAILICKASGMEYQQIVPDGRTYIEVRLKEEIMLGAGEIIIHADFPDPKENLWYHIKQLFRKDPG